MNDAMKASTIVFAWYIFTLFVNNIQFYYMHTNMMVSFMVEFEYVSSYYQFLSLHYECTKTITISNGCCLCA